MSNFETNTELLSYFIESLKSQPKKQISTIENIQRDLMVFLDYLHNHNDSEINSKSISEYLLMLEDKYSESSYIVKASSIRQFIKWLNLGNNPFWKLKLNISYNDFEYYSKEEFAILAPLDILDFDYEHLLINVLYELYASIDELISIKLGDYNKAKASIRIRNQDLLISESLQTLMQAYIKSYRLKLTQASPLMALGDPLFISTKNSQGLSYAEIIELVQNKNLKNTLIKRSRIMHLLDEGKDIDEIEQILKIKLGNFYKPLVKEKDYRLLNAYKQFHPRATYP